MMNVFTNSRIIRRPGSGFLNSAACCVLTAACRVSSFFLFFFVFPATIPAQKGVMGGAEMQRRAGYGLHKLACVQEHTKLRQHFIGIWRRQTIKNNADFVRYTCTLYQRASFAPPTKSASKDKLAP